MIMPDSTKRYYETHAKEYFDATSESNLRPLWRKISGRLKVKDLILDLGCGSGRDLRHFSQRGFRIVGVDYSFNLLKLARDFSEQPVVLADFLTLPFGENTFDAVWAIGSLLHVPRHQLPLVLQQIYRVLKPDALFFTSMKSGYDEATDLLGRHTVFYQKNEWESILREHCYAVIESEEMLETRGGNAGAIVEIGWITATAKVVKPASGKVDSSPEQRRQKHA